MDPGKRPTGHDTERIKGTLRSSLKSITVRRRVPDPDQAETIDIHAVETYLRRAGSNWLFLPPQLEDCRGCYYLG